MQRVEGIGDSRQPSGGGDVDEGCIADELIAGLGEASNSIGSWQRNGLARSAVASHGGTSENLRGSLATIGRGKGMYLRRVGIRGGAQRAARAECNGSSGFGGGGGAFKGIGGNKNAHVHEYMAEM